MLLIWIKLLKYSGTDQSRKYYDTTEARTLWAALNAGEIVIFDIDGKLREMTFISNNFTWAASSICDLYKAHWSIEIFSEEIKQTLQFADFSGYNENAVCWQI